MGSGKSNLIDKFLYRTTITKIIDNVSINKDQSKLFFWNIMKRNRYQDFFEYSADAMLIIVEGEIVDCNASAVKMFRFENKKGLIGASLAQLSPDRQPDGRLSAEKANEIITTALEKRKADHFEWDYLRADGCILPVAASISPVARDNLSSLFIILRDITEQKKAEKEKRESNKKFEAIFNHRFQLTGLLDADGQLLMANQAVCDFVDVTIKELEGKYLWELPHFCHSKEVQLEIRNAIHKAKQGESVRLETAHQDFKGQIHFFDFSLTPVKNEQGKTIYIVPEGLDITSQKQSERRLVTSERNYREIFNSSNDAIFIHDSKTGKIVGVNQTMTEMYGYSYEEALQLKIGDISSGEPLFIQKMAIEKIQKALNEGPQLFEWFAKRKNGTCFWVEVSLRKTKIGGKNRVLAVVRDITNKKQLDNELRLIKSTIEHSAFPFEWIQKDSSFLYVNEATCRSLGYSREELYSMKVGDIDPGFSQEVWPEFWRKLKAQKHSTFETYHCKKNGEKFPVKIVANHVEFEAHEYIFAYVQDISEIIRHEKEQQQLQEELQQAQKMECIGRLAGGVAHDFNNFLSVIIGHCDLLLVGMPLNDPKREKIKLIHEAGNKSATLTRQLLTLSRKQVLEKKIIDINTVIQDFLKILGKITGDDIVFKTCLAEASCTVEADSGQIEQILMNMTVNARDAMPDGGEIIIETTEIQIDKLDADKHLDIKPGQYILLTISDSGEGMNKEIMAKIFDPFFTTKERGKGTGLGLATVYGIVKQHNGYIYAYSERNRGTTFKIYFPASKKTEEEKNNNPTTKTLPNGNETILIVDDNSSICQLVVEILKPLGYNCLQATSGKDAIKLIRGYSGDVHLLLTDVIMSGISGKQLAETIVKERPKMKVIFMSGYTDNIIAHHGVLEQGINYISKPITPFALTQKIRSVLAS